MFNSSVRPASGRPSRFVAVVAVLALGLAACGDDETTAGTSPVSVAEQVAPPESADIPAATDVPSASADVPLEEVDPAERIISLSPSATEMLFAIGAGDQVIAVDDQSNYPEDALAKQTDLSGYTPNVEAIAAFEPDLVVHDGTTDLGTQLDALGIANYVGASAPGFDDIYAQIEQLGALTGHVGEAAELVGNMQTDIEAAIASIPAAVTPLKIYHELDPTLFSVNSNTFIGHVYALFGLINIADTAEGGTDYPQLSAEFIISQNPDLIFLADSKCCGESPETVAIRDGWSAVAAVTAGRVVVVDDDIASRWGPRVVDYIEIVSEAVTAAVPAG